jgi:hypothetical protein
MKIDIKKILPEDPSSFHGFRAIRIDGFKAPYVASLLKK